jgi:hypothetical protein
MPVRWDGPGADIDGMDVGRDGKGRETEGGGVLEMPEKFMKNIEPVNAKPAF